MESALRENRGLLIAFTVAVLLHGLLLTIPAARQAVIDVVKSTSVKIRLTRPEPRVAPEPPVPEPVVESRPARSVMKIAPPPEAPAPVEPEPAPVERISAARILLDIEKRRNTDPPWFAPEPDAPLPVYRTRPRASLDDVLNEPVLHLPFEDTRIYLVDSYSPGFMGSVDRFFDNVTVPFGFTTKNNTRIQCAWTLIVAGCVWGDAGYFYSKQEARKRE